MSDVRPDPGSSGLLRFSVRDSKGPFGPGIDNEHFGMLKRRGEPRLSADMFDPTKGWK